MLSKNRTYLLLVILVVALGLYFLLNNLGSDESNFNTELPSFDTSLVNKIELAPAAPNAPFHLLKENNHWYVELADKQYAADPYLVSSVLSSMNGTNVKNVVATSSEQWETYNVTEESGTRVRFMKNNKPMADLVLGRFEYIQPKSQMPDQYGRRPQGEMLSYVRISDEQQVYAIDGMIAMGMGKKPEDFRNKRLVQIAKENIIEVDFSYRDGGSFQLVRDNDKWKMGEIWADSASMVTYLRNISSLRGKSFTDILPDVREPYSELRIISGSSDPITLKAYEQDTSNYVITSSQNPTNIFLEQKDLFEKAFVEKGYFLDVK